MEYKMANTVLVPPVKKTIPRESKGQQNAPNATLERREGTGKDARQPGNRYRDRGEQQKEKQNKNKKKGERKQNKPLIETTI
jgi:hypothetical protein